MTFSVLITEENKQTKVIGTVWATEESQANTIARAFAGSAADRVCVKKTEERELPLRLN
jgi:hypothetical protein